LLHKDVFYACSSRAADMPRADGLVQHGQIRQWGHPENLCRYTAGATAKPMDTKGFRGTAIAFWEGRKRHVCKVPRCPGRYS
jgi:hypothetical protein